MPGSCVGRSVVRRSGLARRRCASQPHAGRMSVRAKSSPRSSSALDPDLAAHQQWKQGLTDCQTSAQPQLDCGRTMRPGSKVSAPAQQANGARPAPSPLIVHAVGSSGGFRVHARGRSAGVSPRLQVVVPLTTGLRCRRQLAGGPQTRYSPMPLPREGVGSFQIRGILGFNFENNTHGSGNTNLWLLIVRPSTRFTCASASKAGRL